MNTTESLMHAETSALLVIDLQQRLLPAIAAGDEVLAGATWLCRLAQMLEVPVVVSEQYPKGLGATLPSLRELTQQAQYVEKLCFSAAADNTLDNTALSERQQLVICGTETHVCVLQTAMQLQQAGKQVFIVEEAVGSRSPRNKQLALERMARAGIEIVSGEMVAFEWLRRAGTEQFRQVSRELIR